VENLLKSAQIYVERRGNFLANLKEI
jgi:hypothetical protein